MTTMNNEETIVLVRSADDMNDETFALHMTLRHPDNLGGLRELAVAPRVMPAWRAFHRRLHNLFPRSYQHEHES
jgi:hypothetical protein